MQGDNGGAEGPPTPIKSAAKGAPKMAWHPYQTGPDHLEASTYEPLLPITSIFPGMIDSSWTPRSARSFSSTWGPHSVGSIESSWMPRSARYFFSTRDPHSEASINSSWIHRFARHCYCKRKSLPVSLSHLPDKQFIPCYFSEEYVHSNIPFDSEDSMVSEP